MASGIVAVPAPRVAVIAALPREIAPFCKQARPDPALKKQGITLCRIDDTVAVAAGMGAERAMLAFEAALRLCKAELIISAGFAGACDPMLGAGVAIEASEVIDTLTGERYATDAPQARVLDAQFCTAQPRESIVLASTPAITGVQEKERLHASYGAAAVDMEAATVARLARARGIPFRAIKGVSDGHDFDMEGMNRFTGKQGEFKTGRFALHTAVRPWTWRKAVQLGGGSQHALAAMTELLRDALQQHVLR
jgi:adenosylhomocysteine nucleosidase